jgi:hydroxyacylglutathione hydrolase
MVLIDTVKVNKDAEIIDIRGVAEFNSGHIAGAKNVFIGTLLQNLDKVPKDKPVIIHCQGGDRAAIGYSLLIHLYFVENLVATEVDSISLPRGLI